MLWRRWYVPLGILLAGAWAFALWEYSGPGLMGTAEKQAGAVVKILREEGHGSGVHIGNGYILTAKHVLEDMETVSLETDTGKTIKADVLWGNKARDVALLRTDSGALKSRSLVCRETRIGEHVTAVGNPAVLDFIRMQGQVASAVRDIGPWQSAVVVDFTAGPGMSGGPVYDRNGYIIGLAIGTMVTPIGGMSMEEGPLLSRRLSMAVVSFIVPSSTICMLMGRR